MRFLIGAIVTVISVLDVSLCTLAYAEAVWASCQSPEPSLVLGVVRYVLDSPSYTLSGKLIKVAISRSSFHTVCLVMNYVS